MFCLIGLIKIMGTVHRFMASSMGFMMSEFKPNLDKVVEEVKTYVQSGIPSTYVVVS